MESKENLADIVVSVNQLLKSKQYKEDCIKRYNFTWSYLKEFMSKSGIEFYNKNVGEAYLKKRLGDFEYQKLTKRQKEIVRHVQVLSDYHETKAINKKRASAEVIIFKGELGKTFNDFINHSISLKRCKSTIQRYKERINTLYQHLQQTGNKISEINAIHLIQYLSHLEKTHQGVGRNNIIMTIRVFFRYLCENKTLQNNREEYWMSILKPQKIRQPKIPSVYSREEVERLIKAIDRGSAHGKRDYAIILLAARYGLRVSDIIGLRYNNFDWTNNQIILLQQKTGEKVELPLSEEVGNAIIEYLQFGRPDVKEPYVFITAIAPHGKLSSAGVHRAITDYMRQADIGYKERKHGPHALRHSLASNLLSLNEPLPVISEILGHSNTESTMCYLRVNFKQLQQCALEVPYIPSSFYDNLYE